LKQRWQAPAISHVVVRARHTAIRRALVAYFVPLNGASITTGELIAFLQQTLPEYLIPSAFVKRIVSAHAQCKIDHNALPLRGTKRPALSEPLMPPRSELSRRSLEFGGPFCLDEVESTTTSSI